MTRLALPLISSTSLTVATLYCGPTLAGVILLLVAAVSGWQVTRLSVGGGR